MISPGFVFIFFLILIFWAVKGQNIVQNDKKFCLSYFTAQEPYIISLPFMIHKGKIIISPGNFFVFQNFDFLSC